jgi:hypothetical protein
MFASYRTESTFEEIPIMLVVLRLSTDQNIPCTQFPTDRSIPSSRDLKDATNPDPEARKALATRIRDACINVGFFYGSAFPPTTLRPVSSLPIISSKQSRDSRVRD